MRYNSCRPIDIILKTDVLIGVFAYNRDAVLVTNNEKDFLSLGVTVENWTK